MKYEKPVIPATAVGYVGHPTGQDAPATGAGPGCESHDHADTTGQDAPTTGGIGIGYLLISRAGNNTNLVNLVLGFILYLNSFKKNYALGDIWAMRFV